MTVKRPPITNRMKIDALLFQAWRRYFPITCAICSEAIEPEQELDWDHTTPLALGGEHHYGNLRPLHRGCHRKKTSGTKATSAGSDIHKIAKANNRNRTEKFAVQKKEPTLLCPGGVPVVYGRCPKCGATERETCGQPAPPKGRKMQSRPFQKIVA